MEEPEEDDATGKDGDYEVDDYVLYVPLKQRRQEQMSKMQKHLRPSDREVEVPEEEEQATAGPRANVSLIDQATEIKKKEAGWY
jgi:ATP-dependent RNA helicase DDX41